MAPPMLAMSTSILVLVALLIAGVALLVVAIRSQSVLFLGAVMVAGLLCCGTVTLGLIYVAPMPAPGGAPVMRATSVQAVDTITEMSEEEAVLESIDVGPLSAPRLPEVDDPEGQRIAKLLVSTARAVGLTTEGALSITEPLSGGWREVEMEMWGDPALLASWVKAVEALADPALEVLHSGVADAPPDETRGASLRVRARLAKATQPETIKTPSNPGERK